MSPTGVGNNATITLTWPAQFTGTSSILFSDVDFEINGVDETVVAGVPAAGEWGFTKSGYDYRLVSGSAESLAINASATIKIGTNANGGVNQVVNPTATTTSYEFTITTSSGDAGQFRVAITDNVLVTANVNTTLTFNVLATTTGAICNGADATFGDSSSNALPFGTLASGVPKTLCQDLTVATNAIRGYVVTVEQETQLLSSTGADIDGFVNGNWTVTPTAWSSPSSNVLDENTWGHWGVTSSDATTTRTLEFGVDQWVAASTTPVVIMSHDSVADGVTDGIGRASIGYQVEISALQEAGDDYSTRLTYISTPTF